MMHFLIKARVFFLKKKGKLLCNFSKSLRKEVSNMRTWELGSVNKSPDLLRL